MPKIKYDNRKFVKDLKDSLVSPNKEIEYRVKSLESSVWVLMALIFILNIVTSIIVLRA